jgi:putative addiction module component (TIGR02574 family)
MENPPPITRIVLYVRELQKIADFYIRHFGFISVPRDDGDLIELASPSGGCGLVILQASKGHRIGQSCVKIVFDVEDIEHYKQACLKRGLKFGTTHHGKGYAFANARDPAKNLIQISSSAFRNEAPSASEQIAELDRRMENYRKNPMQVTTWEAVKKRIAGG